MNVFLKLKLLLFFLLLAQAMLAQGDLSLSQAIEIGLKNNYQIQISERQEEIAKNNNNFQAAGRYPSVNFIVSSNNSLTDQNNPASFLNGAFLNGGITGTVDLAWTLFDGFKVRINKKRLEELERQGQGNTRQVVENTIQQIILAYHQVLIQEEQVSVLREVLDLSRDRVTYQEIRRDFGQAGTFDVLQTNDAFLNDSTNVLIQEQSLLTAIRNLNLAMGDEALNKTYRFTDALSFETEVYDFDTLQTQLFSNNVNIQNLLFARNLATIDRELQESNRYPRITANTGANLAGSLFQLFGDNPQTMEPFDLALGNSKGLYLNLSASYPLYDAGARKRNLQNARIQESIAQLNIEEVKRNLSLQLRNTLETYRNQLQLINLAQALIDNASRNLEISEERFKAGQISSFDYRSIQLAYINASQARLNAIFNLKNTETELVRLNGGLLR